MKILAILCLVVTPLLATKEYTENIKQLLDDPELIYQLMKRLGSDEKSVKTAASPSEKKSFPSYDDRHSSSAYGDTCQTTPRQGVIIKTVVSRNAGAEFLGSFEERLHASCLSKCCETSGCDEAVYENKANKTKHNCYLFKCRDANDKSVCEFDNHTDYVSTTVLHRKETSPQQPPAPDQNSGSKSNSDSLAHEPPVEEPVKEVKTTPRPTQLPHSVALDARCLSDRSCEDTHAMCYQGTCQCQPDYYKKDRFCREVCGSDRFECASRGTGKLGPDCIPKSQQCDGTTECADGSDERNCPAQDNGDGDRPTGYKPDQDKMPRPPSQDLDMTDTDEVPPNSSEEQNPQAKQESGESSENKDGTSGVTVKPVVTEDKSDSLLSSDHEGSDEHSSEEMTNTEAQTDTDTEEGQKATAATKTVDSGKKTGGEEEEKKKNEQPVVDIVDQEEDSIFVTKERVIVSSPTDNAQGPIVALSLGLAITLMLLVFVGCRLRNVRRRLRKGRPLHSNEADYLINGMYL